MNYSRAKVDGKPFAKDKDYTAYSGRIIIELRPAYLETLSAGEHTLTEEFKDGTTETVVNLPQTGDKNHAFIYLLIGLPALAGLSLIIKKRR